MRWTEEETVRLTVYVLSGELSFDQIVRLMDRSASAIRTKLRVLNLRIINEGHDKRSQVIEGYLTDQNITNLSKTFKISESAIRNILMWGKEQKLIEYNSSKWSVEDKLKISRAATLVNDRQLYKLVGRTFSVADTMKQFWGIKVEVLIGLDINEFAEIFKLTESDEFPIIETAMDIKGEILRVVPWCFIELYEAKNPEIDFLVEKMASFQRFLYQEMNRDLVLDKMVKIIQGSYSDKDYYPVQ